MMKVRILDRCEFCDGEAYVFVCEDVDARGETFDRYRPCDMCNGSGNKGQGNVCESSLIFIGVPPKNV